MTSYATRTQSSTEQNDLKKLKSKYSSKLPTLKELFADWSDEDLLFALDEADGVLEVAVDRISEGHATQWGEVKTKKAKKEAQQKAKAAAAASVPSSAQTMSYQKPERTYSERPKPAKARVPSTNNYSRKPAATTTSSWGYNSGQKPSSSSSVNDNAGGSWASIASTKPAHDSSSDWNSSSNNITDTTITSTTTDSWNQSSWTAEDKEITETTTSSALLDDADKPKSWASLLKSQPKPEPVQKPDSEWNSNEEQQHTTDVVDEAWNTKEDEPVKDEWSAPIETPADAWNAPVETATEAWGSTAAPIESEPAEDKESKKTVHQLTEDSPVVMPKNNDVNVSSVDVKFGSLNLDDDVNATTTAPTAAQESAPVEESLTDTKVESQPQPQAPTEPTVEQNATATTNPSAIGHQQPTEQTQQPSYLKQEAAFAQPQAQAPAQLQAQGQSPAQPQPHQQAQQQPQQIPQLPQQIPQQQQQQHQPFGMDHLTSAYSSYLPNQHPTGMSGFGMSPMGNLPDYGAYGTEAQRVAAMGYYDPSSFNNSPAASNASSYPSRDKFGQDSSSIGTPQGQTTPGQTQGLHGQQMYPGMPYYPYYYMPNHYNAYQQSMYGQPMMNKNMYPNMYQQQQQAASVSKPSSQSPYGGNGATAATAATASPYALHSQLYGQQPSNVGGMGGGYDDLQQPFGLHDYQKSPYGNAGGQQLQGFLGHHLQGQQQPTQQPSQQGQGQPIDPSKNDASRGNVTSSSQPQQQPHQMNYFGQQQMFNYQQYPQQQYWNQ